MLPDCTLLMAVIDRESSLFKVWLLKQEMLESDENALNIDLRGFGF
jgi:hypothetical protein